MERKYCEQNIEEANSLDGAVSRSFSEQTFHTEAAVSTFTETALKVHFKTWITANDPTKTQIYIMGKRLLMSRSH